MKRFYQLTLLLLLGIIFSNNDCFAAAVEEIKDMSANDIITQIPSLMMEEIKESVGNASIKVFDAANRILMYVTSIAIVFLGYKLIFNQESTQTFVAEVIKLILFIGLLIGVINFGFENIVGIIDSVAQIPIGHSSVVTTIDPSTHQLKTTHSSIQAIWELIGKYEYQLAIKAATKLSFANVLAVIIGIVGIFALFLIMANYIVICVKMYFVMGAGILAVGLGGLTFTNQFAISYLKAGLSLALQLMSLIFMIQVGTEFINNQIDGNPSFVGFTAFLTNTLCLIMFMFLFAATALSVPSAVGNLIDSSMGGAGPNALTFAAASGFGWKTAKAGMGAATSAATSSPAQAVTRSVANALGRAVGAPVALAKWGVGTVGSLASAATDSMRNNVRNSRNNDAQHQSNLNANRNNNNSQTQNTQNPTRGNNTSSNNSNSSGSNSSNSSSSQNAQNPSRENNSTNGNTNSTANSSSNNNNNNSSSNNSSQNTQNPENSTNSSQENSSNSATANNSSNTENNSNPNNNSSESSNTNEGENNNVNNTSSNNQASATSESSSSANSQNPTNNLNTSSESTASEVSNSSQTSESVQSSTNSSQTNTTQPQNEQTHQSESETNSTNSNNTNNQQ